MGCLNGFHKFKKTVRRNGSASGPRGAATLSYCRLYLSLSYSSVIYLSQFLRSPGMGVMKEWVLSTREIVPLWETSTCGSISSSISFQLACLQRQTFACSSWPHRQEPTLTGSMTRGNGWISEYQAFIICHISVSEGG